MPFRDDESDLKNLQIVFATVKGKVRKNSLEDFSLINSAGKIAMKLDTNDKIVGVKICKDDQDIMLSTKKGKCIRFESKKLRVFKGRSAKGIKGISLSPNDEIVSLSIVNQYKIKKNNKEQKIENKTKERFILSITENGYGNRVSVDNYNTQKRGQVGVIGIKTSARNGKVVGAVNVGPDDQIIMITNKGKTIKISINDMPIIGRNTQGVRLQVLQDNEKLVAISTETIISDE